MRIALFIIIVFCGRIVDELGMLPDYNRYVLYGIAGWCLAMDYLNSKKRHKK